MGSPCDRGSGWPIGLSAHPHPPTAPTPTEPKVYLLQEHPGLRGTPLAMLAAQCNKLSSMSPPPLADAAVGKGFHPWKKGGGSPEQAASVSRQGGTQSTPTSNQPAASTFSTSPQQATSPSPAYGEQLLMIISVRSHFLYEYDRSRYTADAAGVMPKYLHHPNSCRGIFPRPWHRQPVHLQTDLSRRPEIDHQAHTRARLRPGRLLDGPEPPCSAVISTFSPQMGGRAHDSSRQSIGCQISIVITRPLLHASLAQEALRVSSARVTRHSAPATASFSDRVWARNPHILYLPSVSHHHLHNSLLQELPPAFTPSPAQRPHRCRARWRPPRRPSSARSTRPRPPLTSRCRACTAGWPGWPTLTNLGRSMWRQELHTSSPK